MNAEEKKDPLYEMITALINQANGPIYRRLIIRSMLRKVPKS